jgi:hypothetical protein
VRSGTEHGLDNVHCGEKLDGFGSRTEETQFRLNKTGAWSRFTTGVIVIRVPTDVSAAERARWLAELAQVLQEAQELVSRLAVARGRKSEALDVCARLEAAYAQVQSLRRSRTSQSPGNVDPIWSEHLPWDRALPEQSA